MKIYQLFHELVQKFAPMDDRTSANLSSQASDEYGKVLITIDKKVSDNALAIEYNKNLKEGDTPAVIHSFTLGEKVIMFLERWYAQYLIAILFIIFVPMIRNYLNGDKQEPDDDADMFEQFKEFKRYKNGL